MLDSALTAAAATTKSPVSDFQEPAYSYPEEDMMSLNSYRAEKGATVGASFQVKRKTPISRENVLSRLNLAGSKKRQPPQTKTSSGSLSQFKYVRRSSSPPKK